MPRPRAALALAWLAVAVLTAALVVANARDAVRRYRALDSGWSWDLAYYNQWFWSLTRGDGTITVRPSAAYGQEDMSIWRGNYLSPIRLAIAPFYALRPGPETLLAVQALFLWMVIPAAFVLALGESRSVLVALTSTCLVPLTPLLGPIAANDFRELQIAIPFVVLAVEGVRGRRAWLTAAAVAGMLACRQEYAVLVATLGVIPPRRSEDLGRTARWFRAMFLAGVGWFLLFLFYLGMSRGANAAATYLEQFTEGKCPPLMALPVVGEIVLLGLGAWAAMLVGLPRMWLVVLPWAWCVARSWISIEMVGTEYWSSVRYMAPLAGIGISAGLVGLGRSARLVDVEASRLVTLAGRLGLVAVAAEGMVAAHAVLEMRFRYAPPAVAPGEVADIWSWVRQVGPDDGVIADYSVAAPLSSRRTLRSYRLETDRPYGFPHLGPEYAWVFSRPADIPPDDLTVQGFEVVHRGGAIWVYHRADPGNATPNRPPRRIPLSPRYRVDLEDYSRVAGIATGLGLLAWPWCRLRRAWRSASVREAAIGERGPDVVVVTDSPRDLADPARRVVRLATATALARHEAARTLAAVEAAHLRIALAPGPVGWLARYRPALTIAARSGAIASALAAVDGLALGCRPLLDLGVHGLFAAAVLGLAAMPLEYLAVREARRGPGDLDPALLSALPWRHVLTPFPLPWRRDR